VSLPTIAISLLFSSLLFAAPSRSPPLHPGIFIEPPPASHDIFFTFFLDVNPSRVGLVRDIVQFQLDAAVIAHEAKEVVRLTFFLWKI